MKRGKRIAIFVCFVLFVGCLLWLVFSTRAQFKTLKNNVNNEPSPYQGPEIHRVVVQGGLEKIKLKLNQNPSIVSSLDPQRNTLLHLAARYGHTEIVKFLIANRVDINARDEAGYTPLASTIFYCFRYGGIDLNSVKEVVEILIDSGVDVNTKTRFGYTPLHHAADWGTKEVVELLISAGANINARDHNGNTPLNGACRYRRKKKGGVIELLHKHGAVRRHGKNNSYNYEPDLIGLF